MTSGRYTPKKEKTWREAMETAIEEGKVEAVEVQALWCKRDRTALDCLSNYEDTVEHAETCEGPHHVLFIFEPVL